jgi:asparagine synthase (glutamine-hydrolysing)
VGSHLVADVPVGTFLSGGLDSGVVTAMAQRAMTTRLKTVSIGFEAGGSRDESRDAAALAAQLGCEHRRVPVDNESMAALDAIVGALEDPLADTAIVPLWHLCAAASGQVKVALSGEGGDEVLGGYARYFWAPLASSVERLPRAPLAALAAVAAQAPFRTTGPLNQLRRATKLIRSAHLAPPARYLDWFEIFTPDERRALGCADDGVLIDRVSTLFQRAAELGLDDVQRIQYVDISTFLLDNILLKSDKLSMAHSLEVRVPFLQEELVEVGLGLPMTDKVGARGDKVLLRKIAARGLPGDVARRPKRGFEPPVDRWLRTLLRSGLAERLQRGALQQQLGLAPGPVAVLFQRLERGEDVGRRLFALTALERWAARYA